MINENPEIEEDVRCTEMLCLCSKTYYCYDNTTDNFKFTSKSINKRTLEDFGGGPMSKYRIVFGEALTLKSTNRGFKTSNHQVGPYEYSKKSLSKLYPKKKVLSDGTHTRPLNL